MTTEEILVIYKDVTRNGAHVHGARIFTKEEWDDYLNLARKSFKKFSVINWVDNIPIVYYSFEDWESHYKILPVAIDKETSKSLKEIDEEDGLSMIDIQSQNFFYPDFS